LIFSGVSTCLGLKIPRWFAYEPVFVQRSSLCNFSVEISPKMGPVPVFNFISQNLTIYRVIFARLHPRLRWTL